MAKRLTKARVKELEKLLDFVYAYNRLHFALHHSKGDGQSLDLAKEITTEILELDNAAISKMKEFISASEDLQELIEEK